MSLCSIESNCINLGRLVIRAVSDDEIILVQSLKFIVSIEYSLFIKEVKPLYLVSLKVDNIHSMLGLERRFKNSKAVRCSDKIH